MKRFKEFSGYKKAFAGFLNKGKQQQDQEPDFDESRLLPDEDGYFPAFAGFLNKNTKKKKKKLHEDILKTFGKTKKVGPDNLSLHSKLVRHYKGLGDDYGIKHAIENYTGDGYRTLNGKLFNNKRLTPYEKSYESYLSKGLKIHKTPTDIIVHTGIKKDLQNMAPLHGGVHKLKFPAYTSTSIERSKADGFARNKETQYEFNHNYEHVGIVPPKIVALHKQLNKIANSNHDPDDWEKHNENVHLHREKFEKLSGLVKKHNGKVLDHESYANAINKRYNQWSGSPPANASYKPQHRLKYHEMTRIYERPKPGHVISIHVPKGSHGAYVDNFSNFSGEREFILHKGAKVHIHPEPEYDKKENKYRWKGVLVHDGVKPTGLK